MAREHLHLRLSSQQFSDSAKETERDLRDTIESPCLGSTPDAVGFGEATGRNLVGPQVLERARDLGYAVHRPRGDSMFIVAPWNTVLRSGYEHVLDGRGGHPKGNYSDRGIAWVTFRTIKGNEVTVHATHWLTGYRLDGTPGVEHPREEKHRRQTDAMVRAVREHARGRRVSFWMGDTNVDEDRDRGGDPDAIHARFEEAGLVSIYDALRLRGKSMPSTHGSRTIDVIGHFRHDGRVKPKSVEVGPRRNSDHRQVDAHYAIKGSRIR